MTMWLSVDPMANKYPSISPYAYCAWNPVKLVDPDGREFCLNDDIVIKGANNGVFYDVNGKPLVNGRCAEAHIPLSEYNSSVMPPF